ncbi:MAG: hypothetical protein AAFX79_03785 [Planctomycetota bacterium]
MSTRRGTQTSRRSGFSMVEATLAVILVGTSIVAAVGVAGASARANGSATNRRQAEALAGMLMNEVLQQSAATDGATSSMASRLDNYDHVLDYDGFSESPPRTPAGVACAPAGWSWEVAVASLASDAVAATTVGGLYEVTVTVIAPDGTQAIREALRGDTDAVMPPPVANTEFLARVDVTMTLSDGTDLFGTAAVESRRPPGGPTRTEALR